MYETQSYKVDTSFTENLAACVGGSLLMALPFALWLLGVC